MAEYTSSYYAGHERPYTPNTPKPEIPYIPYEEGPTRPEKRNRKPFPYWRNPNEAPEMIPDEELPDPGDIDYDLN